MIIAGIAVAAAVYTIDKPYDYLVPDVLAAACRPGVRVVIPFGKGNRSTEGIVLTIRDDEPPEDLQLKEVALVLDEAPVLNDTMLRLAAFLRDRCFCTFFEAIRAMLPAGLWFHARNELTLTAEGMTADLKTLMPRSPDGIALAGCLRALGGSAEESVLRQQLAADTLEKGLRQLRKKKLIVQQGNLIRNIQDKTEKVAELAVSAEEAREAAEKKRRAPLQKALLDMLVVVGSCSVKELTYFTGAGTSSVKALEQAGLITLSEREVFRRPETASCEPITAPIVLRAEQQAAYDYLSGRTENVLPQVSLLYGVTGSGKTMVYLRLIQDVLRQGRTALVLVPEIALTPQLLKTFMGYFGDRVAVLHSALQVSQRYDEWKRIRSGQASVVLGTRSAVFAPLVNPGIIIVDEEHETTYKSGMNPRYHAREIAVWRGIREHAQVVLGSATPSLESMYLARTGKYGYVRLTKRYNGGSLPGVMLADMKEELKNGNGSPISSLLREEIQTNLRQGQQTILFLNRRGTSSSVLCPVCGYVPHCPNCSVSLTYHAANGRLMCHYCGYSQPADSACPKCGTTFRQIGTGTQRVEEELHKIWPAVETIRMDADTVSVSNTHEQILQKFSTEKIPILIGTQMVTKGLNFPDVTLVGVLDGDASLYTDDFRASEITFAKIAQVIGRAGRGAHAGRAVIQTMTPENEVLLQAACQDYDAFYASELPLRRLRSCPPFLDVFSVEFYSPFEREASRGALQFRDALSQLLRTEPWQKEQILVMGPAPAAIVRVNNRYHYRITIMAKNSRPLRSLLSSLLIWFKKDKNHKMITAYVDCNPMG